MHVQRHLPPHRTLQSDLVSLPTGKSTVPTIMNGARNEHVPWRRDPVSKPPYRRHPPSGSAHSSNTNSPRKPYSNGYSETSSPFRHHDHSGGGTDTRASALKHDFTTASKPTVKRHLKNSWLYSAQELTTLTPSVKEGVPSKVEMIQRSKGVNFIVQVGSHLNLPQMTVNAASTFLHRFYLRYSLNKFHHYDMGAACLFLATKVEETNRRLRDVAVACTKIASKNPKLVVDEQSKDYWRWRDTILLNEDILLEALCFDMSLESPYSLLSTYVEKLGVSHLSALKKCAWAFVNDSCRTTLCIMFPTKVISAAAIYWASKYTKNDIPVPHSGDSNWWDLIDVDKADIKESCNIMADLYESLLGSYQADVTQKYVRVTSPQDLQRSNGAHEESADLKRKSTSEEDEEKSRKLAKIEA